MDVHHRNLVTTDAAMYIRNAQMAEQWHFTLSKAATKVHIFQFAHPHSNRSFLCNCHYVDEQIELHLI